MAADRHGERRDRDRDGRRAGAIPRIDLNRERVEKMGQRQPHGANLLPARRDAVDDAPRDDEMAARVVVAEREAERVIVDRDPRAAERPPATASRPKGRAVRDSIITCLFYG